ncbi:hypothetical protein G7Z17_g8834 [Cylindrodendrum hubeiense]|uniref:Terpene synthase n=1 Tax=Cylindrodendrum hubeiense TaxID=595255 RepID=A0A9P5LEA6_9HYPO|nr:hypothetical protein G7Z17_g8834 [Cylindrodendrum hubeiense]
MKPARLDQDAIIAALKGQTLRVPDLTAFFRGWLPAEIHQSYAAIVPVVDGIIDHMAASHPLIARRKRDDIAKLVSMWYPRAADRDILETLALYAVWLICWDDAVDEGEGDLAEDFEGAERWRGQTLEVVRNALGIDGTDAEKDAEKDADAINAVFRKFGDRYSQTAPVEQRRRLYKEIRFFITSCSVEQKLRLEKRIPDYDSYMDFRLGTVAIATLCSLVEYANQEQLPDAVAAAPQVRELWTQVTIMGTLINDILSLKKELRTDCIINVVTSLLTPEKGLDEVVGELEGKLRHAVDVFDNASRELLELVSNDEQRLYNISKLLKDDGSLEIVL